MKYLLLILALIPSLAFAQSGTKDVRKAITDNLIAEDLNFGTGRTLTMASGSTLNVTGATVTGLDYQPLDATLTALAGATTGADLLSYWTGTDTLSSTTLTSFGRSLIDDADASAARSTLGLTAGTATIAVAQVDIGAPGAIGFLHLYSSSAPFFHEVYSTATASRQAILPNKTGYLPIVADSGGVVSLAGSEVTGTLTVAKGGTGLASYTAGDILYATGATTLAKLAKGTAGQVLTMNAGATAPEWASGGGGLTIGTTAVASGTAGRLLFEGAGNVVSEDADLSFSTDTLTTTKLTVSTGVVGDLIPSVDATYDLGGTFPAPRWKDLQVSGMVNCTYLRLGPGGSYIYPVPFAGGGGFRFTDVSGTDVGGLMLGGSTASYPAIKRNGAGIDFRLADDSDFAMIRPSIIEAVQVASGGSPSTNSARIYVLDNAGTAAWYTKNEAGSETIISPHDATAPSWFYDKSALGQDRVIRETNEFTGVVRYTNETRRSRLMELMLDAQLGSAESKGKLELLSNEQKRVVFEETFAEHNTRRGLEGEKALVKLDWNAEQEKKRAESIAKREAWVAEKAAFEAEQAGKLEPVPFKEPEPEIVEIKPSPLNTK